MINLTKLTQWLEEAKQLPIPYPNAMALATSTREGHPSVRIVLLKAMDEQGLVFYTNYQSRKGKEIAENPQAALLFHWPHLGRKVEIEGKITPVAEEEADRYYHSRPFLSRVGAWGSKQSEPMAHPGVFYLRIIGVLLKALLKGGHIPRPPHWSGFRVSIERITFEGS